VFKSVPHPADQLQVLLCALAFLAVLQIHAAAMQPFAVSLRAAFEENSENWGRTQGNAAWAI
jgi:hypothetical protein